MNMFNYSVILCPIFYKSTIFHLHKPHTLWEDSTVVYYAVTNCKTTIQTFYKYLNFQFTQISKPVIFSTSVQTDNRVKILLKCECMIRPTIAIFSTSVDFMFSSCVTFSVKILLKYDCILQSLRNSYRKMFFNLFNWGCYII